MTALTWNRYGKSRIRLVKVRRPSGSSEAGRHEIVDLTIDVSLEGAFDAVYIAGDNRSCLPTDTMKNTVYAFARRDPLDHVEAFALRVADHFAAKPHVSRVRLELRECAWRPLASAGRPHPRAFERCGDQHWTAVIVRDAGGATVTSGLTGLVVFKTADSAFAGFPRDEFTTLPESGDRILATSITAAWHYARGFADFGARDPVRTALVETFAAHQSKSLQHTLYAMGEAALAACPGITEVSLSLPNRHHLLVDLAPFGLDNPNEVFVATEEPFGVIEGTISRRDARLTSSRADSRESS